MRKKLALAMLLVAGTVPGTNTFADDAALEKRIAELEKTVRLLSRKLEVADEITVADKARAVPNGRVKAGADGGFALVSADNQYELKFRALMQFDGRFGIHDDVDTDTFLLRQLRPSIEGRLGKYAAFTVVPEFADDGASIVDGYIDANLPANLLLRAGQFKAPVGLERLQPNYAIFFTERAFPTELAPDRDRGVQLSGAWLDRRLSVELALSNGTPDGRKAGNIDGDGEQELSARVFFEPLPGIGFGVAGTHGQKTGFGNAYLPRYRSPAQQVIFQYQASVAADGDHNRITPQAYAFVGRIGLLAEYIESEQQLQLGTVSDSISNSAAQLTGIYALTGEQESFKGIKPSRAGGAWELALRYASLDIDKDAFSRGFANPSLQVEGAREWAIGLNWTITPNLKALTSYTVTQFDGGAPAGGDRDDETALFTRLQLSF